MAIENTVFNNFLIMFVNSINVFDCRLSSVVLQIIDLIRGGLLKGVNTVNLLLQIYLFDFEFFLI